jgi:hypothetical protein
MFLFFIWVSRSSAGAEALGDAAGDKLRIDAAGNAGTRVRPERRIVRRDSAKRTTAMSRIQRRT